MDSSEYHQSTPLATKKYFSQKLSLPNLINLKSQSESESEFSVSDMDGNAVPGFKRADMRPWGYPTEKIGTVSGEIYVQRNVVYIIHTYYFYII